SPSNTGRAVVALALNTAVEHGAPYRHELAALDPASVGQPGADALKTFADTGVPSAAALARELAAVLPEARKAADVPAASGGGHRGGARAKPGRAVPGRPSAQPPAAGRGPARRPVARRGKAGARRYRGRARRCRQAPRRGARAARAVDQACRGARGRARRGGG